jgi:hypothetical protein
MPAWYEKILHVDTARQFIEECRSFTTEYIVNFCPEVVHQWPFSNKLPSHIYDFEPDGAIVHISDTPSMWNAINMLSRHMYGSHFVIMAGSHNPGGSSLENYPLLSQLPATVLMIHDPDQLVAHAGYLSQCSWGIELRNTGRLRPYRKGMKPTPLTPAEETDRNFKAEPDARYDCYWRPDLWRYPFPGPACRWEDYFYEMPSMAQVHTLVAVLRVLHQLHGLDRRLIVPSNCVSGSIPTLPVLPWDYIRECATAQGAVDMTSDRFTIFSKGPCTWETHDLDWEDESLQGEIMERARWRGELDDGKLVILDQDREFAMSNGYARTLGYFGYDVTDPNFSLHMWAMAQELGDAKDSDIYNRLNQASPFFGSPSLRP